MSRDGTDIGRHSVRGVEGYYHKRGHWAPNRKQLEPLGSQTAWVQNQATLTFCVAMENLSESQFSSL